MKRSINARLRILIVIDSLAVGGAEQSLAMVAPYLVKDGIDLHVAYLVDRVGVGGSLDASGVSLHSIAGGGGRIMAVFRGLKLLRSLRPDLVHTILFEADVTARVAARLARIPVVSSFVTELYGPEHLSNPEYRRWKVRAAHLTDAITARLVRRFHAVSASSADLMATRLRVPRDRVEVIPRGRDLGMLGANSPGRRADVRRSLGLGDQVPLVMAAGRHYHMKGLDLLLSAFAGVRECVPEAHLLIAGREGPASANLRRTAATGGLDEAVTFAGHRTDVPDLMCAADVVVVPSRTEGSPGVLIEAMALEVPVVASDIPSVREVAGGETPVVMLVSLEAPDEMAAAISRVLVDKDLAKSLVDSAKDRFTEFYTIEAVADKTIEFYRRALRN